MSSTRGDGAEQEEAEEGECAAACSGRMGAMSVSASAAAALSCRGGGGGGEGEERERFAGGRAALDGDDAPTVCAGVFVVCRVFFSAPLIPRPRQRRGELRASAAAAAASVHREGADATMASHQFKIKDKLAHSE